MLVEAKLTSCGANMFRSINVLGNPVSFPCATAVTMPLSLRIDSWVLRLGTHLMLTHDLGVV